jgi:hypothetical protein
MKKIIILLLLIFPVMAYGDVPAEIKSERTAQLQQEIQQINQRIQQHHAEIKRLEALGYQKMGAINEIKKINDLIAARNAELEEGALNEQTDANTEQETSEGEQGTGDEAQGE